MTRAFPDESGERTEIVLLQNIACYLLLACGAVYVVSVRLSLKESKLFSACSVLRLKSPNSKACCLLVVFSPNLGLRIQPNTILLVKRVLCIVCVYISQTASKRFDVCIFRCKLYSLCNYTFSIDFSQYWALNVVLTD